MEPNHDPRLRGWALAARTLNLGRYNSAKFELGSEFWLDSSTHEAELKTLDDRILSRIKALGLVARSD